MLKRNRIILTIEEFSKKFYHGEIVFTQIGVVVFSGAKYRVHSCNEDGEKVIAHEDIETKCLLELI